MWGEPRAWAGLCVGAGSGVVLLVRSIGLRASEPAPGEAQRGPWPSGPEGRLPPADDEDEEEMYDDEYETPAGD